MHINSPEMRCNPALNQSAQPRRCCVPAALMAIAGIAWGIYSLRGRWVSDPLRATAGNFLRSMPFTVFVSAILIGEIQGSWLGVALAIASGAFTSAIGYVIWYAALTG